MNLSKMNSTKINTVFGLFFLVIVFAVLGFIDATSSPVDMLVKVLQKGCLFSVVCVSMNLLNGFTGLFSLGQAGFMLIGAYSYAIFSVEDESRAMVFRFSGEPLVNFQLPIVVSILIGGALAALFAFLIGLPVLKLKSDYLAIATLGFAEIMRTLVQWDELGRLTNGSFPLSKLNTFKSALKGTFLEKFSLVIPFFVVSAICIAIIAMLIHSTYGRAFRAIKDDEIAAEAMGINLAKHKMISFVVSSFFSGIAGALYAIYIGSLSATQFTSAFTYELLLIVVIGGLGSISGSVLASFLYVASQEWWLRGLDSGKFLGISAPSVFRNGFRLVVFSVIIMLFVLFFRKGIMGSREFNPAKTIKALSVKFKKTAGGNTNVK